jgi:hypothetical protein
LRVGLHFSPNESQERAVLILSHPSDRVEFMISRYCPRCASFTHGARNSQYFPLLRATICKIANEDHLPFGMPKNAFNFGISELV